MVTMAGTHTRVATLSLSSLLLLIIVANSMVLCLTIFNYHSIVHSMITLSAKFQLLSIVTRYNARISMGLVNFQFAYTTHFHCC